MPAAKYYTCSISLSLALLFGLGFTSLSTAHILIPSERASGLYYHVGGGPDNRIPATPDTTLLNLSASLNLHAGYQCGVFNPAVSLRTTLNELHSALKNAEKAVIQNATAAVAEFPMYELARINPTLYNILTNNLIHARQTIRLAVKSCEQVHSEIARGQNPYKDWGLLALGRQWEQHIGLALEDPTGEDPAVQSITQTDRAIREHPGEEGLAWVQGEPDSTTGQTLAGGKDQPPIHVIHDTVMAGYQALQPANRTRVSSHLTQVWPTAQAAADWAVRVLGDEVISTCQAQQDCPKGGTTVGQGLLAQLMQREDGSSSNTALDTASIKARLQTVVARSTPPTQEDLQSLSTATVAISPAVIRALRRLEPLSQTLLIDTLAQAMALQAVVDRALLARRLLLAGRQVPLIASQAPARRAVQQAIHRLEKAIDALLWEKRLRQTTLVAPLQALLKRTQAEQHAVPPPMASPSPVLLEHGARSTSTTP